jgi:hypothetical protein
MASCLLFISHLCRESPQIFHFGDGRTPTHLSYHVDTLFRKKNSPPIIFLTRLEAGHSYLKEGHGSNMVSVDSTITGLHLTVPRQLNELYFWTLSIVWCLKKLRNKICIPKKSQYTRPRFHIFPPWVSAEY